MEDPLNKARRLNDDLKSKYYQLPGQAVIRQFYIHYQEYESFHSKHHTNLATRSKGTHV